MKGKDFAELLTEFADLLSDERAAEWRAIPPIFGEAPTSNVVAICSVLSGVQPPLHSNGSRLHEMVDLISALKRLLLKADPKKAVIDDLTTVETTLKPFGHASTRAFADAAIQRLREREARRNSPPGAVRSDVVQHYLRQLEEAFSDATRFAAIFDELKEDKAVKAAEAKMLAREFAKETTKSRNAALDLIWGRHAALMGSHARQRPNKGRTAA